ncbi:hypothetical protein I4U23_024646 [Adineta vaga]|nr:hypothetical protein I4U23_024646 [Adineta vaga]
MQGHQLILFALLITVTYATRITFFGAYTDIPIRGNQSTVGADRLILYINVTDCSPRECMCEVVSNTSSSTFLVNFTSQNPERGSVNVLDLQADTLYSFELICLEGDRNVQLYLRTDYGRPSPPQNVTPVLESRRVRLSWLRPTTPAGPIHNYRLKRNQNPVTNEIPGDALSYVMTEDYVFGSTDVFGLTACNTNNKNESICSDANQGTATFYMEGTTTPIVPTTKPSSANGFSYSIVFPVMLFYNILFR